MLGHDWQREAETLRALGDTRAARRAEAEARDLLERSPAAPHLFLTLGRGALAEEREALGRELLYRAAHSAWEVRSPIVAARAALELAESYACGSRADQRRLALECCIFALAGWPFTRGARDFLRAVRLGRDLVDVGDLGAGAIARRVDPGHFPFDLLPRLTDSAEARLREACALLTEAPVLSPARPAR
jgi:hypothetical protein